MNNAVPSNTASTAVVCALDRVRPATEKAKQGMQVSPSVNARLNEGRHQRKRFLREILGDGFAVETTESLVDLSEDSEGRYGNLARKIAVIYLDGNKFGDLKRNYSARPESLRALDNLIQGYRKDFLRQLVESARQDEDFLIRGALRLEILIWGGDEVLLVVPAWKGMETLQRFFEESSDWFVPDDPHSLEGESDRSCNVSEDVSSGQGKRLTHAGGIVFCSHKTPIAESTKAAKALAESVKDFTRQDNRFDYLVLESIDYPTQEINAFRRIKYGAETVKAMTPLAPFTERSTHLDLEHLPWDKRIKKIAEILDTLPRGPLLGIARAWVRSHSSPGKDTPDAFDDRVARLENVNGAGFVLELHQHLLNYFVPDHDPKTGHDHPGWLHLAELWDYLAPNFTSTRRKS